MTQSTIDMLTENMRYIEERMSAELDIVNHVHTETDPEEFIEKYRDILEDLDLSTDPDEWDAAAIEERVRDSLHDVLEIKYERGEPFCVVIAWGGPNIYLVDLGHFGGKRLAGYWGFEEVIRTNRAIEELVDYFLEYCEELY